MKRLLDVNKRVSKQTFDNDLLILHSIYKVANGAYHNTGLRAPAK